LYTTIDLKRAAKLVLVGEERLDVVSVPKNHFEILATGRSDVHCKIKETLLIKDLKPALNKNVGSEKLLLY